MDGCIGCFWKWGRRGLNTILIRSGAHTRREFRSKTKARHLGHRFQGHGSEARPEQTRRCSLFRSESKDGADQFLGGRTPDLPHPERRPATRGSCSKTPAQHSESQQRGATRFMIFQSPLCKRPELPIAGICFDLFVPQLGIKPCKQSRKARSSSLLRLLTSRSMRSTRLISRLPSLGYAEVSLCE
jgi:hypothetical protein